MRFALAPLICFTRAILIHCFPHLQAMSSDDDFVFGGPVARRLPAPGDADGEDDIAFAGVARPAPEASDSDDGIAFAVPVHREPLPQRRRRAPLQTSGSFWTLAAVGSGDARGVVPTIILGVVEIHWELASGLMVAVGQGEAPGVCGTLVYTARRVAVFNEGVALAADVDVTTMAGWLRTLEVVGPQMMKTGAVTLTAFLAGENAKLVSEVLVCADTEAETLLRVAEEGTPSTFRQVRIHKRWADPSRIIARHPAPNVLRRWRKQHGEQGERVIDSGDSGDGGGALPGAPAGPAPSFAGDVDPGPFLYIPPQHLEKSARPTLNTTSFLHQDADPVRIVHALAFARWLRSPKYFVEALDDSVDYLLYDEGCDAEIAPPQQCHGPKGADHFQTLRARRRCVYELDASSFQAVAPRWILEINQYFL